MSTVAVLTGPERRRRWSASDKARIVEESLMAGAVVAEVARRHDVHLNLLHSWRRQVRRAGSGFVPVTVAPRHGPVGDGAIEIELPGGVRLRVAGEVDEGLLRRVLQALR